MFEVIARGGCCLRQLPPLSFVLRMGRRIGERHGLAFRRGVGRLLCLHGFGPPFLLHS